MRDISSTSTSTHQSSSSLRMPTIPSNSLPVSSARYRAARRAARRPFIGRGACSEEEEDDDDEEEDEEEGEEDDEEGVEEDEGAEEEDLGRLTRSARARGREPLEPASSCCDRRSVALSASAMSRPLLSHHQSLDQLVLTLRGRDVVDLPFLPQAVHLLELASDRSRVVVDVLGLTQQLVSHSGEAPQGRQRQREQTGDQAHADSSTKS